MTLPRRIAHLDMDAFYASVELLRYPELAGQPVVIGGGRDAAPRLNANGTREYARLRSYVGRGVITTCTYAARAFGLRSGMPTMQAARLCPEAVLLPVDFPEYRRYSRRFKAVVRALGLAYQDRGIDEIYIDITSVSGGQEEGGRMLAERLQRLIRERTGLGCSIGVAPNKLLAKMASEFDKPNGLTVIYAADLESRIWPLPCVKLNGVGPRTNERLQALGIGTIGELARFDRTALCAQFGPNHGAWLQDAAWGRDDSPIVTHSEPVSMSRETTFERDMHAKADKQELGRIFTELCQELADDLERRNYAARTIGIKLRYDNFKRLARDLTLETPVSSATDIRRAAGLCLKRAPLERRLRLLGVRAAKLHRYPVNCVDS